MNKRVLEVLIIYLYNHTLAFKAGSDYLSEMRCCGPCKFINSQCLRVTHWLRVALHVEASVMILPSRERPVTHSNWLHDIH